MLTRDQKQSVVTSLRSQLEAARGVIFLSLQKLSTPSFLALKKSIREQGGSITVVKKTFLRLAQPTVSADQITGAFAVVTDPSTDVPAFALLGKQKDKLGLEVFGGFYGSQPLSSQEVWVMASLPAKPVMISRLVGSLVGQLSSTVLTVRAPLQRLCGVLTNVKNNKAAVS